LIGFLLNLAPKRTFILLSFLLLTASTLLLGPSPTLGLSAHFTPLFYVGLALNGFAQGLLLPPALPEVLDSVYARQRLLEGADEVLDALVADRASGLYGVFICAGTILAPVVGSWVFSALGDGWGQTCDVFSVVGGIWTVSYAVFNVLPDVHKEGAHVAEMEKALLSEPLYREKLKSMMLKDQTRPS
jgi:MFS family permease